MPERGAALRDLILVIAGLKAGVFNQDALLSAFDAWDCTDGRPFVDALRGQGALADGGLAHLEALAVEHLRACGGDADRNLPTVEEEPGARFAETVFDSGRGSDPAQGQGDTVADTSRPVWDGTIFAGTLDGLGNGADQADTFMMGQPWKGSARFQVLRPHAVGGLGIVSVAHDAELNREVALKQIKDRYADDPMSRARFLLEAEITGGLEHPGIVPVYSLGNTPDGRPYYVMRFIKGKSLKDAIAEFHNDPGLKADPTARRLALRKLLRRFVDVCETMEYAHRRGVLHRDIKPANIMVGRYGETLVVDWGIAKAVGRPEIGFTPEPGDGPISPRSGSDSSATRPGLAMGTPAYMSPEQARGDLKNLSAASDVYSLGATLYSVLTGKPLFQIDDLRAALDAAIRGEFLAPRRVDRSVDPSLEAVCLRAIRREPADRYSTARALADDVERWMADEPVSARPEPLHEKVRRFARRRRTAVTAAAAAMVVAMISLTVLLGVQSSARRQVEAVNQNLEAANNHVQQRFKLAMEAVGTFHTGVSEDLMLNQVEFEHLRRRLLDQAEEFYERLKSELEGKQDRPSREALAQAYFNMGELASKVGFEDKALKNHGEALALRSKLALVEGGGVTSKLDLARSYAAIARIEDSLKGRKTVAADRFGEALWLLQSLDRDHPGDIRVRAELGFCLVQQGRLLGLTKGSAAALENYEKARAIWTEIVARESRPESRRSLAQCEQLVGNELAKLGRRPDAYAALDRSRQIRLDLVGDLGRQPELLFDLAASENSIARLDLADEAVVSAIKRFGVALELRQAVVNASPGVADYQLALARTHHSIANAHGRLGHPDLALGSFDRALVILEPLRAKIPRRAQLQRDLAAAQGDRAAQLWGLRRPLDALKGFRNSLAAEQELVNLEGGTGDYRRSLALSHQSLGKVLSETGHSAEGLASFRAALDEFRVLNASDSALDQTRREEAACEAAFARALLVAGRPCEAAPHVARGLASLRRLLAKDTKDTAGRAVLASSLVVSGLVARQTGRDVDASRDLAECLKVYQSLSDEKQDVTEIRVGLAECLDRFGEVLADRGLPAEALLHHRRARAAWDVLLSEAVDSNAYRGGLQEDLAFVARAHARLGHRPEAEAAFTESIEFARSLAALNPELPRFRTNLAAVLTDAALYYQERGKAEVAAELVRGVPSELASVAGDDASVPYEAARAHAVLGRLTHTGAARPPFDAAVAELAEAVRRGFRDSAAVERDPAFGPLLDRPDLAGLWPDLLMPVEPFALPPE